MPCFCHGSCSQVPSSPSKNAEQHARACALWPCQFVPAVVAPPLPLTLNAADNAAANAFIQLLFELAGAGSASGATTPAVLIVDPITNAVVATGIAATCPSAPLHSAVMIAVEAVAASHRAADSDTPPADAPYLCTGLDVYSSQELDAM